VAQGKHGPQQNNDGPVDALVDILQGNETRQHHDHRCDGEGDLNRQDRFKADRAMAPCNENAQGQQDLPGLADPQAALGQRQAFEVLEGGLQGFVAALQQKDVADKEFRLAQAAFAAAARGGRWPAG
jgi:hypothetical protein